MILPKIINDPISRNSAIEEIFVMRSNYSKPVKIGTYLRGFVTENSIEC